jgi:pyruvate dehydrogenase E2 component (dihydrolipoamide acetyltransferase)
VLASPLARKLAAASQIDLGAIRGSGPGGRIVKRDLDGAAPVAAPAAPPARAAAPAAIPAEAEQVPHSTMRKIIARRLSEAWQTIPHIFLSTDCELDRLLDVRKRLNDSAAGDTRLSVNDFILRAAAFALRKVPELNVQWTETAALRLPTVDIAVAVAVEGGLVTPIVRNADEKGLAEISAEVKELAGRGKEGKLMPEEYQGGSFTISNLGMFGVTHFGAIINPPQAAILAVGAGAPRAVVRDGAIATATVMTCTLSCDHRIVDGADGAKWLAAFKGYVEEPMTMML